MSDNTLSYCTEYITMYLEKHLDCLEDNLGINSILGKD